MNTENSSIEELGAFQLSDSFFPTGMYTTSNGLEALQYANKKKLIDPKELSEIIKVYLECQIGPADCTALGNSYDCAEREDLKALIDIDRMIFSMKLVKEIREASTRSGVQLLRCLLSFVSDNKLLNTYNEAIRSHSAAGVYPVAFAIACKILGVTKKNAGLILLYGFTVSMVGAALRLGMLQHFDGQRVIHELKPDISQIVRNCIGRPLAGMWQFAPAIDTVQIKHERMVSKMFIT